MSGQSRAPPIALGERIPNEKGRACLGPATTPNDLSAVLRRIYADRQVSACGTNGAADRHFRR